MILQGSWTIKEVVRKFYPPIRDINHWPTIYSIVERLRPTTKRIQVKWERPPVGRLKVNTDGSYLVDSDNTGI
ncbi:hypothetical protein KY285_033407 [Solanum tuberosum]|nr:hypothetical protein KY285_033407 [Solanum tuberosum]